MTSIHLSLEDARNAGCVRQLRNRNERKFPPCMLPTESSYDPYLSLGSHPDTVERLWQELNAVMPVDCRCILFGIPALVAPRSGIILAHTFGTVYLLRVPIGCMPEALAAGARREQRWPDGRTTDLLSGWGEGWIFGAYSSKELDWCLAAYNEAELPGGPI